jgi:hypothetical protein
MLTASRSSKSALLIYALLVSLSFVVVEKPTGTVLLTGTQFRYIGFPGPGIQSARVCSHGYGFEMPW